MGCEVLYPGPLLLQDCDTIFNPQHQTIEALTSALITNTELLQWTEI